MRLTAFEKNVDNISRLADRPNIENGYTASEVKALFDKAGIDLKGYINTVLLEELMSAVTGASGADRIGSGHIETLEGDSVQSKLEGLASKVRVLANGNIPDGTIDIAKLEPEVRELLESGSVRAEIFSQPGEYAFEVRRPGTYKITAVGGGAGGGVLLGNSYIRMGGGSGAGLEAWLELIEGDRLTVRVGSGGAGLTALPDGKLNTHAECGGDTSVSMMGEVILRAEGGRTDGQRARAHGGDICRSGSLPTASELMAPTYRFIHFGFGGDSILGSGGSSIADDAGLGGGGFGAVRDNNSGEYTPGTRGGDGAVIIEYVR